jgi:hypothetical protein
MINIYLKIKKILYKKLIIKNYNNIQQLKERLKKINKFWIYRINLIINFINKTLKHIKVSIIIIFNKILNKKMI